LIDRGKLSLFGIEVNAIDYEAALEKILQAAQTPRAFAVSATAVHGLITAVLDPEQAHRLNSLDLVVPDGMPLVWALNSLYRAGLPDRVYGPNLMLKLCEEAAARAVPVYFYGSRPEVLERLVANLTARYPALRVAGAVPSLFRTTSAEEQAAIASSLQESGAGLVFVGLGCPRQEVFVYEMSGLVNRPLVAVGAAFEFHAGTQSQAPLWMQRRGLEWLFRLSQEPRRLARRYLMTNPLFLGLWALSAWLGPARVRCRRRPPEQLRRYG